MIASRRSRARVPGAGRARGESRLGGAAPPRDPRERRARPDAQPAGARTRTGLGSDPLPRRARPLDRTRRRRAAAIGTGAADAARLRQRPAAGWDGARDAGRLPTPPPRPVAVAPPPAAAPTPAPPLRFPARARVTRAAAPRLAGGRPRGPRPAASGGPGSTGCSPRRWPPRPASSPRAVSRVDSPDAPGHAAAALSAASCAAPFAALLQGPRRGLPPRLGDRRARRAEARAPQQGRRGEARLPDARGPPTPAASRSDQQRVLQGADPGPLGEAYRLVREMGGFIRFAPAARGRARDPRLPARGSRSASGEQLNQARRGRSGPRAPPPRTRR